MRATFSAKSSLASTTAQRHDTFLPCYAFSAVNLSSFKCPYYLCLYLKFNVYFAIERKHQRRNGHDDICVNHRNQVKKNQESMTEGSPWKIVGRVPYTRTITFLPLNGAPPIHIKFSTLLVVGIVHSVVAG